MLKFHKSRVAEKNTVKTSINYWNLILIYDYQSNGIFEKMFLFIFYSVLCEENT